MGRVKRLHYAWYVYGCDSVQRRHIQVGRVESGYHGLHVLARNKGIFQKDAVRYCLGAFKCKSNRNVYRIVWIDIVARVRLHTFESACIAAANLWTGANVRRANRHTSQHKNATHHLQQPDDLSKVRHVREIRQGQLLRSWRRLVQAMWRRWEQER